MVNEFGLKGCELIIYAIIFGFSFRGDYYTGGIKYLTDWTGCSKKWALKTLNELIERRLIIRYEQNINNVIFVYYKINPEVLPVEQSSPVVNKVLTTENKVPEYNINNNIPPDNNIIINNNILSAPPKGKFVPPAVEDVKAYCEEKGFTFDPEAFVAYYESNGWMVGKSKMKNWKAACITWQRNGYSKKEEPKEFYW
jgi:hypothetical protein